MFTTATLIVIIASKYLFMKIKVNILKNFYPKKYSLIYFIIFVQKILFLFVLFVILFNSD